jgi:hypothetical protein
VAAQSLPTTTAPDLHLEWVAENGDKERPRNDLGPTPPIEGHAGQTVRLKYRIRNVGSTDAFAVIVRVQTGLGNGERPMRIQPGPAAGKAIERTIDVALAVGLAEVCVGAVLQTIRADDPRDPFTEDNRICRRARCARLERGNHEDRRSRDRARRARRQSAAGTGSLQGQELQLTNESLGTGSAGDNLFGGNSNSRIDRVVVVEDGPGRLVIGFTHAGLAGARVAGQVRGTDRQPIRAIAPARVDIDSPSGDAQLTFDLRPEMAGAGRTESAYLRLTISGPNRPIPATLTYRLTKLWQTGSGSGMTGGVTKITPRPVGRRKMVRGPTTNPSPRWGLVPVKVIARHRASPDGIGTMSRAVLPSAGPGARSDGHKPAVLRKRPPSRLPANKSKQISRRQRVQVRSAMRTRKDTAGDPDRSLRIA